MARSAREQELTLTPYPESLASWLMQVVRYRDVLFVLTRKDLQTRYKRATFGLLWAIAVPALQAVVMAIVFSHIVRAGTGRSFPVYIISGVVAYSYLSLSLPIAVSAIVEASTLTDKVWFPRALLPIVPCLANLVGLIVSLAVVLALMPALHAGYGLHTLVLLPATVLLVAFTLGGALLTSALQVYFRDVKFIIQAAFLVWMYATPIAYPQKLLGRLAPVVNANPLTGIVDLFHIGTVGTSGPVMIPVLVSCGVTSALLAAGAVAHSVHDRLFVDLL